jgi:uncharacterized membrane protein YfcA
MFLELGTTAGALAGAFAAGMIEPRWLLLTFAAAITYTALMMGRYKDPPRLAADAMPPVRGRLRLSGAYTDPRTNEHHAYRVGRSGLGFIVSIVAGVLSGLLGIGGGAVKVPVMTMAMGIPIKVATATSNFMIGVTAIAGAGVYYTRGDIDPYIAGPTAVGVLCGTMIGTRFMIRLRSSAIRWMFTGVLLLIAVQMLRKGLWP